MRKAAGAIGPPTQAVAAANQRGQNAQMRLRLAASTFALAILPAAIHLQNKHVHGPPADYVGVLLASGASWIGLPGPGEAILVAAGILAAHNRLNLGPVLVCAWVGATAGGVAGWVIGLKAGRALIASPGPFLRARQRALRRSERLYERFGTAAVILTPSWAAGIARMRTGRYLLVNAVSAALWAALYGLGAYLTGRTITDLFSDLGLVGAIVIGSALLAVPILGLVGWYRGSNPIPDRLRRGSGSGDDSPRGPAGRPGVGESASDRGDTED
jgi:membrane protein DedA with SNARE-associated domain